MAREKQDSQVQNQSGTESALSAMFTGAITDIGTAEQKIKLEQNQAKFNSDLETLAEKAADMVERYGEEYYLSTLLISFYDVAIQMRDIIDTLSSVQVAMDCITGAMECMDNIMSLNDLSMDNSLKSNYGFIARARSKRKIKKVTRNNMGRIKSMVDRITGAQGIALTTVEALQSATMKMQDSVTKRQIKQNKRNQKLQAARAKNPAVATLPMSVGKRDIMDRVAKRGGSTDTNTDSISDGAGAPPTAGGGVDDTSGLGI